MSKQQTPRMWRWQGRTQPDGSPAEFLPGLPPRDITEAEAKAHGWTKVLAGSRCYRLVELRPEPAAEEE